MRLFIEIVLAITLIITFLFTWYKIVEECGPTQIQKVDRWATIGLTILMMAAEILAMVFTALL